MSEELRKLAADPFTTNETLQHLAETQRDLWPTLAMNPSISAALRKWLASTGDPATLAALASFAEENKRTAGVGFARRQRALLIGLPVAIALLVVGLVLFFLLRPRPVQTGIVAAGPAEVPQSEVVIPSPEPPPTEEVPSNRHYVADLNTWYGTPEGMLLAPDGSLYAVGSRLETGAFPDQNEYGRVLTDAGAFVHVDSGGITFQGAGVVDDGRVYRWGAKMAEDGSGLVGESAPRVVPDIADAVQAHMAFTSEYGTTLRVLTADGIVHDVDNGGSVGPSNVIQFDSSNRFLGTYVTDSGGAFAAVGNDHYVVEEIPYAVAACASGRSAFFLDQSGGVYWAVPEQGSATAMPILGVEKVASIACAPMQGTGPPPAIVTALTENGRVLGLSIPYGATPESLGEGDQPLVHEISLPAPASWVGSQSATTEDGRVFWWKTISEGGTSSVAELGTPW